MPNSCEHESSFLDFEIDRESMTLYDLILTCSVCGAQSTPLTFEVILGPWEGGKAA